MKDKHKLAFLFPLLIGSLIIFVPVGRFFIPRIPELFRYLQMMLTGDAILDINVAQDNFYIAALHWFGGFSVQLSLLLMFAISTTILCISLVFTAITLHRMLKRKTG
jgi:hypothetical protein